MENVFKIKFQDFKLGIEELYAERNGGLNSCRWK